MALLMLTVVIIKRPDAWLMIESTGKWKEVWIFHSWMPSSCNSHSRKNMSWRNELWIEGWRAFGLSNQDSTDKYTISWKVLKDATSVQLELQEYLKNHCAITETFWKDILLSKVNETFVKIHDLSNEVDILFDPKDTIKVHGMNGCKRINRMDYVKLIYPHLHLSFFDKFDKLIDFADLIKFLPFFLLKINQAFLKVFNL